MDWGALLTAARDRMDEDPEEQRRRAALVAMRSMPQEGPKENTRADGAGLPAVDLTGESPHADSQDMGYLYGRDDRAFRTPPFLPPGHDRIRADAPRLNLPAADLTAGMERRPMDEALPGPLKDLVRNPRNLLLPPYDPSKLPAERLGASEDTQRAQPLPAVPGLATKKSAISPGTIDALIRRYDELLAGQPNREDVKYKPQGMKTWQTIAGAALATLAGAGSRNPRLAGELASDVFNTPKREADERFDRDVADWRRVTQAARNRLGLENVASEIRDRDARADAYADWRSQDRADLKALHAAAVEKAVREGRDPASDPTVGRYTDAITSLQREPASRDRTETPFSVWRQQNPNAPVADYFKLAPEARAESRPPEKASRLTAGQKATAARRYKQELREIESERRLREGGDYVDHRTGQLLPAMNEDELNRRKQEAEDAYKDELEAGGEENVSRYDYSTRRYEGQEQPSARGRAPRAQHQVGDEVTYQGKRYRIGSIRGGRAQLVPLGQ